MLRPQVDIQIGKWRFTYVTKVEIKENVESFTRQANIRLPQRFWVRNRRIFDEININDRVTISMGYYPAFNLRFTGYVTKRTPDSPLLIQCEDESWIYKNRLVEPQEYKDTTLGELINATYTGEIGNIFDADQIIGTWRIGQLTTFTKLLETLQNTFGLTAYWDLNGRLFINQQFETASISQRAPEYDMQRNIISTENMEFQESQEYSQIVFATSQQTELDEEGNPLPTAQVYAFYDQNGDIKTQSDDPGLSGNINRFDTRGILQEDLEQIAINWLRKLNFTGYRGSFLTFGEPIATINEDCLLINNRNKDMQGRYRIKAVVTTFGVNQGYKQQIELSRKTGDLP